jgi:glutamate racemase
MKNRQSYHIGVFDSGVGGLTVMHELARALPHESFIYFGDTARVPYGGKSRETIIRYCIENAVFLLEKNIKLLVVACNTASAFGLEKLGQIFNIPVIGVIHPGAEKAVSVTRTKRIGVLGTKGTIQSGAYQQAIYALLPEAEVIPMACPLFVPLVEERFLHHSAAKLIVSEYLAPLKEQRIDTLLLGCTHYPLLKELIGDEMGPNVTLVDSASTCAEKSAEILKNSSLETSLSAPQHKYFVSDDPEKFRDLVKHLFNYSIEAVHCKMNL